LLPSALEADQVLADLRAAGVEAARSEGSASPQRGTLPDAGEAQDEQQRHAQELQSFQALQRFQDTLKQGGLDLLQPFELDCLGKSKIALPGLSSYRPTQLGVVIGNTSALWPAFLRHLRGLGVRSAAELGPDPLDIYVEELIQGALTDLLEGSAIRGTAAYGHERLPTPIPIQRIAEVAGLARIGPAHLSVHSRFGPWFALRAVALLSVPADVGAVFASRPSAAHPCDGCDAPCRRALSGALLHRDVDLATPGPPAPPGLSERQQRWLKVRDACPIGAEHRYSAAQILYHYDGQREVLLGEAKQLDDPARGGKARARKPRP